MSAEQFHFKPPQPQEQSDPSGGFGDVAAAAGPPAGSSSSSSAVAPSRRKKRSIPDQQFVIIREIYDSENSIERFELELEDALRKGVSYIVLEPLRLGDETSRWISVGNCIHKTAVLSGLGGIVTTFVWPEKPAVYLPITMLSVAAMVVYTVSWSVDPCSKYQVESDFNKLPTALQTRTSSPAVVLLRKDDTRRKILHTVLSVTAFGYSISRLLYS